MRFKMDDVKAAAPEGELRDRTGLLILFGVAEILIGLLTFLFVGLMGLGMMMLSRMPSDKIPKIRPSTAVEGTLVVAAIAIFFLWMGIGTVKGRRWARSIMLVVSWVWLLFGIFMMDIIVKIGPTKSTNSFTSTMSMVLFSFLYVVLPLAFILFYQRKDVKSTFQRMDPRRRWTDACPQPIFALSLILGGLTFADLMLLEDGVYPIFGQILTGKVARGVILGRALIFAWLTRATYRSRMIGWWGTLVFLVLIPAISFWGFRQPDPSVLLRAMDIPVESAQAVKSIMPWFQTAAPGWWLAFATVEVGYLFYVRKFFKLAAGATTTPIPSEE